MKQWAPITYRDFYDIPRMFLAQGTELFLFDCKFDSDKDEYGDSYAVYVMPPIEESDLRGSWEELPARAKRLLGRVRTSEVEFDSTLRQQVNLNILRQFGINE